MNYNTNDYDAQEEVLVDYSKTGKVKPWQEKKTNNEILSYIYKNIDEKKSERLLSCANWLEFSVRGDGTKLLTNANFCRIRLCPMCSWRRSLKIYSNVSRIMEKLKEEKFEYLFLTLTVRNCAGEELNERITDMMKAWERFVKYVDISRITKGWYRGLEVTHNLAWDNYHPHFHVVIVVPKGYFTSRNYLKQSVITAYWKKAMRLDYDPVVDIRKVKGNTAKAICEIAKYTVKDNEYIMPDDLEMSERTVRILDKALKGRRLVAFGGRMKEIHKQLNLDDEEDGDLVKTDLQEELKEEEIQKIYYTWNVGYRNYYKINGLPETKY